MSKIIKIGITELNNKEIIEVNPINLVAGKDRIRCEILNNGKISTDDQIKII